MDPFLELYVGNGNLSGMRVGPADGCRCLNTLQTIKGFFDDSRINITAAPYDQFLFPSCEPEIPVTILSSQIPGIEPAIARPDIPVMHLLQIARKDIGTFDTDCTYFINIRLTYDLSIRVHDKGLHLRVRKTQPHRTDLAFPMIGIC